MENVGGENGPLILSSTELFCLPTVGESLGVQFGVAEHFLQSGVIKGRVSGGVVSVLSGGRRGFGQLGWVGWGTGLRGGGHVVRLVGLGVGGDLLPGGVLGGPLGPRVELVVGPWLSHDVTGPVGQSVEGGYPRG